MLTNIALETNKSDSNFDKPSSTPEKKDDLHSLRCGLIFSLENNVGDHLFF